MKEIPLTQDKVAIVDDDDYETLRKHKWHVNYNGYAQRRSTNEEIKNGATHKTIMHREILGLECGETCDHVNRNKLDNRRENLRKATKSENAINRPQQKNNTSGYKGVYKSRWNDRWIAQIRFMNKAIHIGTYDDKKEAAKAYDKKAMELFGEFALLNNPKCEWCDKILTLFTHSGKFIPENQPPRNYCPNCGRMVKQDG